MYNIICDSIGVEPAPNNGTLRLPLKPTGLHTDAGVIKPEIPDDPPTHSLSASASPSASQMPQDVAASGSLAFASTTLPWGSAPTETNSADQGEDDGKKSRIGKVWQWISDKFNGVKDWAKGVFSGKGKGQDDAQAS